MISKMFKFFVFSILLTHYLSAAEVFCEPELRPYYEKIIKVPEAQQLIAKILQEGSFTIKADKQRRAATFGAYWDLDNRVIVINTAHGRTEGRVICSILFEMHNAAVTSQYDRLDALAEARKIDRESYVESVERLEFANSHNTAKIADRGIEMGLFPRDVRRKTYATFEEHYYWQKYGGHSAWIANTYNQLSGQS